MLSYRCGLILAILVPFLFFSPLDDLLHARDSVASDEERISLPLNENRSITLMRLIDFASKVEGHPILYSEAEVEGETITFTGTITVPRAAFQGFFERLLLEKSFLYTVSGDGKGAIHRVMKISPSSRWGWADVKNNALVVPLDQLEKYADRGILVTVVVPLKNMEARLAIQALNPYFMDTKLETIRNVDNTNTLVITTPATKAIRVCRMLELMDVRPAVPPPPTLLRRIAALEERIAKQEKRLPTLGK